MRFPLNSHEILTLTGDIPPRAVSPRRAVNPLSEFIFAHALQARERAGAASQAEAKIASLHETVDVAYRKAAECGKQQQQWAIERARLEHTVRRLKTELDEVEHERDSVLSSRQNKGSHAYAARPTNSQRVARDVWVTNEMVPGSSNFKKGATGSSTGLSSAARRSEDLQYDESDEFQQELRRTIQDLSSGLKGLKSLADAK